MSPNHITLVSETALIAFCILLLNSMHTASGANCYIRGLEEVECKSDETECVITKYGAPMGCAEAEECGGAAGSETLICDPEFQCCCETQEGSKPCNNFVGEHFDDVFCHTFPNATVCVMEYNPAAFQYRCRQLDDSIVTCPSKPRQWYCSVDLNGTPQGCISPSKCPDMVYYHLPQCNYEEGYCCCHPLVEAMCNDRTESSELDYIIRKEEERLREEDSQAKGEGLRGSWFLVGSVATLSFVMMIV